MLKYLFFKSSSSHQHRQRTINNFRVGLRQEKCQFAPWNERYIEFVVLRFFGEGSAKLFGYSRLHPPWSHYRPHFDYVSHLMERTTCNWEWKRRVKKTHHILGRGIGQKARHPHTLTAPMNGKLFSLLASKNDDFAIPALEQPQPRTQLDINLKLGNPSIIRTLNSRKQESPYTGELI